MIFRRSLITVAIALLATAPVWGQKLRLTDVTKSRIEFGTKQLVADNAVELLTEPVVPKAPQPQDVGKSLLETPVKELVQHASDTAPADVDPLPTQPLVQNTVHESVAPGDVHWHTDPRAAQAAARRSGKPILLFQLLGELDQRFT